MKKIVINAYGAPEAVAECIEAPDVGAPGAGEIVFDLAGHPTATRAYAWSSPIDASTKRQFSPCCIPTG